ncbi:relaxase/mobilization nuclease domain-containing protein [Metapseudomonas otitidis]|uniref:relaxase/mobilization nuclease domain-containing protein n=1 Tax=Metapseudomonas otitidis TaxID=319939 RepID=UPI00209B8F2A|nr:relaxase/mobilization nuclease domain-containing protein [Pseudomonas otitidis]MCO7557147.1 relaxase/mobilization nuclease domain-containing protein [Pseudomonas otitidis]
MINRVRSRTGGYANGVANTVNYQLKTKPTEEDESFESSIPRTEGESDWEYAKRVERVFEAARVPNQKQLYQHNTLSFHPDESKNLSNKQIMEIAKEFYLKEGLGDKNRHYVLIVERDTDHAHVHAAIHLTDLESKRVSNKFVNYNPIAEKLENKYGLYNEHRKPSPFNQEPKQDKKKEFKDDLKSLMKNTSTASGFLFAANAAGYEILHNGNSAYSLEKDGETFKASDLGMSYKSLKARFGDDPGFPATLARLDKKNAENGPIGSIGGPQFMTAEQYDAKQKKMNRVLDLRFDTTDGESYTFKDSKSKAFTYKKGVATFYNSSPSTIKAGLQRLEETTKNPKDKELAVNGSHDFKRKTWLEFHKMGLDKKGFSLSGYTPSATDKKELEQYKNEQKDKFKKRKDDDKKKEENKINGTSDGKSKYAALLEKGAEMQANQNIAKQQEREAEKTKVTQTFKLKPK